jgi:hypothetical protein
LPVCRITLRVRSRPSGRPRLVPVPVDGDGIDPAGLPDGGFALLYLTAS